MHFRNCIQNLSPMPIPKSLTSILQISKSTRMESATHGRAYASFPLSMRNGFYRRH
ncbi:hypothetical protein V6Z12_D13G263900 [Gossypium hirsutum]